MSIVNEWNGIVNSNIVKLIQSIPREPRRDEVLSIANCLGLKLSYYKSGTSRHIIDIVDTGYCIKLAYHFGGIVQNKAECDFSFKSFDMLYNLPLVWNDSYSAILAPKLKTFSDEDPEEVFSRIFNMTAQELYDYVQILQLNLKEDTSFYCNKITKIGSEFVSSWLKLHTDINSTLYNSELPGDYAKSDTYGITETGVVKIIDFGNSDLYFKLTK